MVPFCESIFYLFIYLFLLSSERARNGEESDGDNRSSGECFFYLFSGNDDDDGVEEEEEDKRGHPAKRRGPRGGEFEANQVAGTLNIFSPFPNFLYILYVYINRNRSNVSLGIFYAASCILAAKLYERSTYWLRSLMRDQSY